jgi:TRAP-type mannitol/chloroaromatic compound transport system permease small subunit
MEMFFRKINAISYRLKQICIFITSTMVLFMMFFISIDVLGRNFFRFSIPGNYEIVQNYLMPLIVFPVLAFAYSEGMMPRLEMILDKLPSKTKFISELLIRIINVVVMVLLTIYSSFFMFDGFSNKIGFAAGRTMLPVYFLYTLPPIAFIMVVFEDLIFIAMTCKAKK